jgi:hypothetical protein
MIIMISGTGISAVFWKMPNAHEMHALYHVEMIDKDLAATPLPSESMAMLTPEERGEMVIPALDITPAMDGGSGKYTQAYPLPASLAARNFPHSQDNEEEAVFIQVTPQTLEPMRPILEEKPVAIEPVTRVFQPKPTSVSTTERSDEMLSMFHFAGNSRADFEERTEPESPANPFPVPESSISTPALEPLKPIELSGLSPLVPLRDSDLLPLSELIMQ